MDRADRISARLEERELDALLITDPANLRYVTGFTGSNGLAVVGPDVRRFLTDFRYVEQAAQQVSGFDRERGRAGPRQVAREGLAGRRRCGSASTTRT